MARTTDAGSPSCDRLVMQLTDGPGELRVPSPTGTHRTITVRQLARGMKSYINKVSGKGMSFLIVRNGSPVARLIP